MSRNQSARVPFCNDEVLLGWDGGRCLETYIFIEVLSEAEFAEVYREFDLKWQENREAERRREAEALSDAEVAEAYRELDRKKAEERQENLDRLDDIEEDLLAFVRGGKKNRHF